MRFVNGGSEAMLHELHSLPMGQIIGQNITRLRDERHWSQTDLARRLGCRQGTISAWETGANEPDRRNMKKLVKVFGVTVQELRGTSVSDRIDGLPHAGDPTRRLSEDEIEYLRDQINGLAMRHRVREQAGASEGELMRLEAQMSAAVDAAIVATATSEEARRIVVESIVRGMVGHGPRAPDGSPADRR